MTNPDQPAQSEGTAYGYEPEYWGQLPDEAKDEIRNSAGTPSKVVVKREVEVFAELDPALYVMASQNIDLGEEQTLAEWLIQQQESGETAYQFARELDLFEGVTIHLSLIEHYDDGTKAHVGRTEWSDPDD